MSNIIVIHEKNTGDLVDKTEIQARYHGTNYQAMISWRGITKIEFGDSMDEAVRNVFDKFSGLAKLTKYDIRLLPSDN